VLEQQVDAKLSILIGDDASNDGTSDMVDQLTREHPGIIQHFRRHPRLGPFANMRDLIARADGDFVARLDGDDHWLPGKLARQLAFLQAHPDCSAVYTNAIAVDMHGNRIGLFNDADDARIDLATMLRRGNFLNNSSVLFRNSGRRAWLDVTEPQIDYRVHLWQAQQGWLWQIGEPLTAYRVNAQGSMVASMNDRVRELYWQAIQSVPRELVSNDDYAHGVADFLRRVTFRSVRLRRWSLVREWTPRVMAASPFGFVRTAFLTAASILRILLAELTPFLKPTGNRHRERVLYRS
jgi:glycosyltransferase involved in cell wall biosynthesis